MSILARETAFGRLITWLTRRGVASPVDIEYQNSDHGESSSDRYPAEQKPNENQFIVDWTGPDDPGIPRNWPLPTRLLVLANVLIVNLSFYTAPSIYSAAIPSIETAFGVSEQIARLGMALFVIAYGVGPLILSPISNLPSIGRTPVYVIGSLCFCLFTIGAAVAKNVQTVIILRFFGGLVGTSPTCIGGTTIAEVFGPREVAYAMASYVLSGICGPVFGPLLGTAMVERWGTWAAALWLIVGLSALSTIFLFFLLPETLEENILFRRADSLRRQTGDSRYQSPSEAKASGANLLLSMVEQILGDSKLCFIDPVILYVNIHTMLIYGILYLWFEFFPYVFEDIYGFTQLEQSLAFFGILVGAVISVGSYILWLRFWFEPEMAKQKHEGRTAEPEEHIAPGAIGAISIPICLFIFGWTSRPSIHWIVPIIGTAFFAPGFHLTFQTVLNYLGQSYPQHVAGVFAGNAFFRSAFGGALPMAAPSMLSSLGIGWACSTLAFIALAMMPPLYLLHKYGKRYRAWSEYAHSPSHS